MKAKEIQEQGENLVLSVIRRFEELEIEDKDKFEVESYRWKEWMNSLPGGKYMRNWNDPPITKEYRKEALRKTNEMINEIMDTDEKYRVPVIDHFIENIGKSRSIRINP